MGNSWVWWVSVLLAATSSACGSADPDPGAAGGTGGAAVSGGAPSLGGASSGTGGASTADAWAYWDFLPAGDGARAAERKATCEAACERDGACGFWDPGSCKRRCADPRRACQADLAEDACWSAMVAYEGCKAALTCAELNHLYYSGASVRECQTQMDQLDAACGYVETIAADQCLGPSFDCGDGTAPITTYWVCDGERDCSDGSDEAVCPWLTEGPPDECVETATIDADDTAGDLAALAGVSCIDGALYVRGTSLSDLRGLESLSAVGALVIGAAPSMSFGDYGNPELRSLAGLEGLRGVGSLILEDNPLLTDLTALAGLTFVTSNLEITNDDGLTSLEGLHNIQSIDELIVAGNAALTDLQGLRGLTSLSGLDVSQNAMLVDLSGLEGLPWIGDMGLTVSGNDALVDFTGLNSITSIGNSCTVSGNPSLTSFTGLESLTRFAWSLSVSRNPMLSSLDGLDGVREIRGDVSFQDNPLLSDCSVVAWVEWLGNTCDCAGNDEAATCE
jgi:hypothetical protein